MCVKVLLETLSSVPSITTTDFLLYVLGVTMSEPSNSLKILIVGAGISGLAAAVRLAQHGHHVQIIERTPILNPSGGGIQVSPGVIKIFRHWGLERDFLESGVDVMEKLRFHTWGDGTLLRSLDREEAKGHEV